MIISKRSHPYIPPARYDQTLPELPWRSKGVANGQHWHRLLNLTTDQQVNNHSLQYTLHSSSPLSCPPKKPASDDADPWGWRVHLTTALHILQPRWFLARVVDDLFPAAPRRLTYHPRASHASAESEVHVLLAHGSSVQGYGVDGVRTTPVCYPMMITVPFPSCFSSRRCGYLMIDPFFNSSLFSSLLLQSLMVALIYIPRSLLSFLSQ